MTKTYTKPTAPTDSVLAGPLRWDTKTDGGAAIDTNIQIVLHPGVISSTGTEVNATRIGDMETAIDVLDTKVSDAEIGNAAHDATPADDDKVGYWTAAGVWTYATWLELKTLITSGVSGVAAETHAATPQTPLIDGDEFPIAAAGAAYALRSVLWSVIKSSMQIYMDTIYQPLNAKLTSLAALTSVANLVAIANLTLAANRSIYTNSSGTIAANGVWVQVKKTTDQTKTSTTAVAIDTALQVPLLAGKKYAIRGKLFYHTQPTADFRYKLLSSATPAIFGGTSGYIIPGSTDYIREVYIAVPVSDTTIDGAGTTRGQIDFDILIQNTNAGTFGPAWAQRVSNVNATKLLGGSYIEYMIVD